MVDRVVGCTKVDVVDVLVALLVEAAASSAESLPQAASRATPATTPRIAETFLDLLALGLMAYLSVRRPSVLCR
jgi:hypothetical protein